MRPETGSIPVGVDSRKVRFASELPPEQEVSHRGAVALRARLDMFEEELGGALEAT